MALIRSLAGGTMTSLLLANVLHPSIEADGGPFGITDLEIGSHRIAWSWTVFVVVTIVLWLIDKAIEQIS